MNKGKEVADAAAMGGGVAWRNSGSYDVVLSSMVYDTQHTIADFLFRSLVEYGIGVFTDYNELGDGDEIGGNLLRAIDGAKIYIPIFSRNYASSVWCLKELGAMVERKVKSGGGKMILPIFYSVEPRDVRLETHLYRDALAKHEEKFGPKGVKAWKDALKEAGSLRGFDFPSGFDGLPSGFDFPSDGYHGMIKEIIEEVKLKLKQETSGGR